MVRRPKCLRYRFPRKRATVDRGNGEQASRSDGQTTTKSLEGLQTLTQLHLSFLVCIVQHASAFVSVNRIHPYRIFSPK